jgi:c(7)-type cytochrome triheme protein
MTQRFGPVAALAAGVAAIALLALVLPASGDGSGRRSAIIYPPSPRVVRGAHDLPAHQRLRCERCHVGARESERARDVIGAPESACLPCHRADVRADPSSVATLQSGGQRCGLCHVGWDDTRPEIVPFSPTRPPRLEFSHRQHAREGVPCRRCHADLTDDGERAMAMPTMRECRSCHGGDAEPSASGECRVCHQHRTDGRLVTRFPEGSMNPPRWLFGMHHDRDFLVRHRWVGADHGELCASCHAESECEQCHDGRVLVRSVHPNDWLTIHPNHARRDETSCQSCHSPQTFCLECHARIGVAEISAPLARSGRRFHPPAAQWTSGPNLHAREARFALSTCASCHAEQDCVSCHAVLGVGAGVSPHPADFVARCGSLLAANPRACETCHGTLDDVRARCP